MFFKIKFFDGLFIGFCFVLGSDLYLTNNFSSIHYFSLFKVNIYLLLDLKP